MNKLLISLCVFLISLVSEAEENISLTMKLGGYNRLVLPVAYKDMLLEMSNKDVPVVSLNEGTTLVVVPKVEKDFSVALNLENGDAFTIDINVKKDAEVLVWRYQGAPDAEDMNRSALYGETSDKYKWIKRAFTAAHLDYYDRENSMPGMSVVKDLESREVVLQNTEAGERIVVGMIAKKKWIGMNRELLMFQLVSDSELGIENYDFYSEGVIAVSVEGDVIAPGVSPYVILLIEGNNNGQ